MTTNKQKHTEAKTKPPAPASGSIISATADYIINLFAKQIFVMQIISFIGNGRKTDQSIPPVLYKI